jgi:lipopolysaccharide biosynthesis glycosyltransferase
MLRLFIGYDPREAVVYHACVNSIVRQASQPVAITPLALKNLRSYTERHRDGSNQFTYSRFLVPHLTVWAGWALYIDGDMLLREDVAEIFKLKDESKAVLCVHHDYKTKLRKKYLGARNEDYPRKNWSSVMLWNCAHPANRPLTPEFVQNATGARADRRAAQGMELAA